MKLIDRKNASFSYDVNIDTILDKRVNIGLGFKVYCTMQHEIEVRINDLLESTIRTIDNETT